jgi:hypothetical protein
MCRPPLNCGELVLNCGDTHRRASEDCPLIRDSQFAAQWTCPRSEPRQAAIADMQESRPKPQRLGDVGAWSGIEGRLRETTTPTA